MKEFVFQGMGFRCVDNWFDIIPIEEDKPIQYLEIGAYCGINVCGVGTNYATHPDSRMYVIDPWEKYEEYNEYNTENLNSAFEYFQHNISANDLTDKVITFKGYSHKIVHQLEDNFFDIIYIDGNHEPEYVLEDAVLAFRKLKVGGYLIFDDYGWGGPDLTQRGIDGFVHGYYKRIKVLNDGKPHNEQLFIQRML
jgi:predicted O-methyltransferase YrrM